MKIEDLQETAALAHLNLDEAELAGAFPAFEQMLGFFAAMQAADEDRAAFPVPDSGGHQADGLQSNGLQSESSARIVESGFFRLDNNPHGINEETGVSSLLNNAGERDGRFIVVPNVL
jgi:aspartyl-tRNA(Asn)/glutamyl-tRNA(Gln) amidotransferase subunit C